MSASCSRWTADFGSKIIGGSQPGRLIQTAGKDCSGAHTPRFSGQDDENCLGYLLGLVRVMDMAQSDGINHVDIARDQGCKCFLGIVLRVSANQFDVVHRHHSLVDVRRKGKVTVLLACTNTPSPKLQPESFNRKQRRTKPLETNSTDYQALPLALLFWQTDNTP
jgi:hypothetical protein